MVKLLAVVSCFIIIVGSILLYMPLNNLLSLDSWQSLSYGPASQALLPVFILVVDLIACPLLFVAMSEDI
jgi:hypothetical protein